MTKILYFNSFYKFLKIYFVYKFTFLVILKSYLHHNFFKQTVFKRHCHTNQKTKSKQKMKRE